MGQFEDEYIVQLHGVVTEVECPMIILEYMPKGDLNKFLKNLKEMYAKTHVLQNFVCLTITYIHRTPPEALNELKHDLLSFCRHVAAGLSYLSRKGFVHRDLAARNILVSSDDVCKVKLALNCVQLIVQ